MTDHTQPARDAAEEMEKEAIQPNFDYTVINSEAIGCLGAVARKAAVRQQARQNHLGSFSEGGRRRG